jgi:hypothetical protein
MLLRASQRSAAEIAAVLGIEAREVMSRLALLYDSLWLTHLPRAERRADLERYFAAAKMIGRADAPQSLLERDAEPLHVIPPRRALDAVEDDERWFFGGVPPVAESVEPAPHQRLSHTSGLSPRPESAERPEPARRVEPVPRLEPVRRMEPIHLAAPVTVSSTSRRSSMRPRAVMLAGLLITLATVMALVRIGGNSSSPILAASNTPTVFAVAAPATETPIAPVAVVEPTPAPTVTPAIQPGPTAFATLLPTATPTVAITPPPTAVPPTPTPLPPTLAPTVPATVPTPGVAFAADWSAGLDGWIVNDGWQTAGGLLERPDSSGVATALAPHRPSADRYTIEVTMEPIGDIATTAVVGFAIQAAGSDQPRFVAAPIDGPGRRTYRLDVDAGEVRFLVDGVLVSTASNLDDAAPDRVGLIVAGAGLRVHSFVVIE